MIDRQGEVKIHDKYIKNTINSLFPVNVNSKNNMKQGSYDR